MLLHTSISGAFAAYAAAPLSVRVGPAVPVLYFGNYDAYWQSPRRIITVAVNPSGEEFPRTTPWLRFPNCATLLSYPPVAPAELSQYQQDLDNYFENKPYDWFSSLEPVLKGFDASFYRGRQNRAPHTDLMSPVATDPTWSDEQVKPHRAAMESVGVPVWHELVLELLPHIALISFRADHRTRLKSFPVVKPWTVVKPYTKAWGQGQKTFSVEHQIVQLPGHRMDMVFGPQSFQSPFSGFDDVEKVALGQDWTKGKLTWW